MRHHTNEFTSMTTIMMAASSKIFLLPLFFITILHPPPTMLIQAQIYIDHICSTSTNASAADSAFQNNRNSLLTSLASSNADFFYDTVSNSSHTFFGSSDDTVVYYGLFMCRGDVNQTICHQCVRHAAQRLPAECPVSKEAAIIWYDECLLRYSNRSFFSTVDTWPVRTFSNHGNVSNPMISLFMRTLYDTMNKMADEAAASSTSGKKKYATRAANFSKLQTVYCLAQCTPDLSPQNCRGCLSDAIEHLDWCCHASRGARVLYPSCNVRYELYPFYGLLLDDDQSQVDRKGKSTRTTIAIVVISSVIGLGIFFSVAYFLFENLINKRRNAVLRHSYFGNESNNLEPLRFSLATIEAATNKFSDENCLGRGGFGRVYKGILSNSQEIAVKRLSKSSGQGEAEFKNEVLLIAKLQHRNLVALLGFCIEEQERILIYEYVPNKSLDYFLFSSQKGRVLNWAERCKIIGGIARGILYLHEYSHLKVIHRDLKPNNVLLDNEMNQKISDFGLAKMIAINTNEGSTNRIVGTYGYMSPEYAMYGQYSEKSDLFSYGVIMLEIISGKKNTSHHSQSQYADGLLSYAWKQWNEEKLLEILDSNIEECGYYNEVIKCIQIGLLCVQENPDTRPTMAEVVSYLSHDSVQLPLPQKPAFFLHGGMVPSTSGSGSIESASTIEVTMSEFFPR